MDGRQGYINKAAKGVARGAFNKLSIIAGQYHCYQFVDGKIYERILLRKSSNLQDLHNEDLHFFI